MKALDLVADVEFVKSKKEITSFLQEIDYDDLQSRINQGFSSPGENLRQLKRELGSLEGKIKDYKRDTVSFPLLDKEIEPFIERFFGINRNFRQRVEDSYENAVNNFSKRFARAKKQKQDQLQKTIELLRELSKQYNFFREFGELPENKEVQDYYEFHIELKQVDEDVKNLIGQYKEAETVDDLEDVKEKAQEISQRYKDRKRKSLWGLHNAFKYENTQFNDLEKELKTISPQEIIQIKTKLLRSLAKAKGNADIIHGMQEDNLSIEDVCQLNSTQNAAANERFTRYKNIIFLNELVYQHDEVSETLKRKTSALMRDEAKRLEQRYKSIEEKSKQTPQRFEDISNYVSIVDDLNKELQTIAARFNALGYEHDVYKAQKLARENKARVQEIKAVEQEYDKIWEIKRHVLSLKKEVEEKGISLERIYRLIKLNNRPRSCKQEIKYEGLRRDYEAKVNDIIDIISSTVDSLIHAVDKRYQEAEKNPSYNLDNVLELYQRIHRMTDISDRIERVYALQRERKREDKENKLKKQIADLTRQKQELDEQNKLTGIQAKQYEQEIITINKQLEAIKAEKEEAEVEKTKYEGQTIDLAKDLSKARSELSKRVYEKDDVVSSITANAENDGSFVLCDYLRDSPEPTTYTLLSLKDILEGRTGEQNLFERLNQFSDYLATMKPVTRKEDKEFLSYLFGGLKEDVARGSLGKMIGASTYRRAVVNDTLNLVKNNLAA